jgi:hypothetical protein
VVSQCGLSIPKSKWPIPDPDIQDIRISVPFFLSNRFVLIMKAPILNRKSESVGTDMVVIDMCEFENIVKNHIGLGETSKIIIGYSVGNTIHRLFPSKTPFQQVEKENGFNNTVVSFLGKGINGKTGIEHIAGSVLAYTSLDTLDWGLLIIQNESELYARLHKILGITGLLSFLIYIVFLYGFWLVMKPLAGRLLLRAEELETTVKKKTEYLNDEILIRKKAEIKLEKTVEAFQEALDQVKTLGGLIPICSSCKNIRDDKGYWNQIESYHTN